MSVVRGTDGGLLSRTDFETRSLQGKQIQSTAQHALDLEKHQLKALLQWRPSFHLTAPHGWLNDPCAPGYDPSTRLYHLAFQWNPNGNDWGCISLGHSTSPDLLSWQISPQPCLRPST